MSSQQKRVYWQTVPSGRVSQLHLHIRILEPLGSHHSSRDGFGTRGKGTSCLLSFHNSCTYIHSNHSVLFVCTKFIWRWLWEESVVHKFQTPLLWRKLLPFSFSEEIAGYVNSRMWSQGASGVCRGFKIDLIGGVAEAFYRSRAKHTGEKLCF